MKVKINEMVNNLVVNIKINNIKGVSDFLSDVKFPIYFLDFEAIANSKKWLFKYDLAIDQQLSSFSMLKIDSLNDDESKIMHYSHIGTKENYKKMAESLTNFYKGDGTVFVWANDLEIRGIIKLIKETSESKRKKLFKILMNMIDLHQLFHNNSFITINPSNKSSLDVIARAFNVYLPSKIKDGKKARFLLEHIIEDKPNYDYIKKIRERIKEYNNSDVINIKRIFVEINKLLNE